MCKRQNESGPETFQIRNICSGVNVVLRRRVDYGAPFVRTATPLFLDFPIPVIWSRVGQFGEIFWFTEGSKDEQVGRRTALQPSGNR